MTRFLGLLFRPGPYTTGLFQTNPRRGNAAFDLHVPNKPFLVCEYKVQQGMSTCWLLCHLSLSMHSRYLLELMLYCFSGICWGGWSPPRRPAPVNVRLLLAVCRRPHLLVLPDQVSFSRHALQCHPYWSVFSSLPINSPLAHYPSPEQSRSPCILDIFSLKGQPHLLVFQTCTFLKACIHPL